MSPIRPNALWALDFQFDTLANGRTIKMLNIIDEFTREALADAAGFPLVANVFDGDASLLAWAPLY